MSDRWIPKIGERVSIVDQPGWTGEVRQVIRKGQNVLVRLMPQPPAGATAHPVTEDVTYLENLAPYRTPAR